MHKSLKVSGMTCKKCENYIVEKISSYPGVISVEVELKKGHVMISSATEINEQKIQELIGNKYLILSENNFSEESKLMKCPVCKEGDLAIIYSRKTRRNFVACNKYPDCKTTYSLPPNAVIKKTGKVSEEGLPILVALKRGRKPWKFKFDPNWRANQQNP